MNVLIIDAHPVFRAGLKQILSTLVNGPTIFEACDIDEVERPLGQLPEFDLVLADISIFERDPMLCVRTIIGSLPNVPVIIISAIESREHALEAINLGAQGFIPKTASRDEIVQGLRHVLQGSVHLSKRIWASKPTTARVPEQNDRKLFHIEGTVGLTVRQQQTLALLTQGITNKEIAEELGISDKTVRSYVSAIFKKLNVVNRTQAALIANRAMEATSGHSQLNPPNKSEIRQLR